MVCAVCGKSLEGQAFITLEDGSTVCATEERVTQLDADMTTYLHTDSEGASELTNYVSTRQPPVD